MSGPSPAQFRFVVLNIFFLYAFIFSISAQELTRRPLHDPTPQPSLPDVIIHRALTPPLRGSAVLRFSPDGRFISLQDAAGLFVLQRDPLRLILYIDAPDAFPAQFSNDSRTIALLTPQYVLAAWQLPDGENIGRREWRPPDGCLDAAIAPGTLWLACLSHNMTLDFYDPADLSRKFSQSMDSGIAGGSMFPFHADSESAFSAPIGLFVVDSLAKVPDRKLFRLPIVFSPDGTFFIIRSPGNAARFTIPGFQKSPLAGELHKNPTGLTAVLPGGRVAVTGKKDPSNLAIVTSAGELISSARIPSTFISSASNPAYALVAQSPLGGVDLFNIDQQSAMPLTPNIAANVFAGVVAIFTAEGELAFYHVGELQPFLKKRLPLNNLPGLHAALSDSSLSTLAFSYKDHGATFETATGNRLTLLPGFNGVTFTSPISAILLNPSKKDQPASISSWTSAPAEPAVPPNWTVSNRALSLASGTHSFLEYSLFNSMGERFIIDFSLSVDFFLRSLDPTSGRELWKHTYRSISPIPFTDPQGSRLVLGWKANSDSAKRVSHLFPGVNTAYKNQKIKDLDSLFEVLDAVSGNSLGGVLVQFGTGPRSFDSAFSCGDAFFLVKDGNRISLFNLQNSRLVARVRGERPAASMPANLFVAEEAEKLSFYDLTTGARLAERKFPDGIAYTRFSETGDRLLVLTIHQDLFILDVKKALQNFAVAPSAEPVP